MYFAPVLLCLALLPVCPINAQPKVPADEVQIEVSAPKDRYLGGEPVVVSVVLRNNSSKPVSFLMLGPKFEFAVRNNTTKKGKGKLVGLIGKGRDDSNGERVAEVIVGAHDSKTYKIALSRLFDMSRAGTYTVSGKKNLKLENPAPGGNLIGATKVARDLKLVVDGDIADAK